MELKEIIPPETYSRTHKNMLAHKFTEEERAYIDAAFSEFAEEKKHDELSVALYGLLQKLQDDLKIDDTLAPKIVIIINKKAIDELRRASNDVTNNREHIVIG